VVPYCCSSWSHAFSGQHWSWLELLNKPLAANLLATPDLQQCMQDRKLQLYSFEGVKTREWVMDSIIR